VRNFQKSCGVERAIDAWALILRLTSWTRISGWQKKFALFSRFSRTPMQEQQKKNPEISKVDASFAFFWATSENVFISAFVLSSKV
jgi:hypothetical protein